MKKLNCLPILLVFCLMVLLMSKKAFAGGQIEPEGPPPLAGEIIFMAWYEEQLIHVALANISDAAHELTVSVGTRDVGTHIYGSQKLKIQENSILILEFLPLAQRTVRGDLKISDTVFVYSHDPVTSGHVGESSIQNIGQDHPSSYLKDYVVESKVKARFNYNIGLDKNLDIVLIPNHIILNDFQMTGIVKGGAGECTVDNYIKNLDMPYNYRNEIENLMKDHFCFAIEPDTNATISIDYQGANIDNCKTVKIPVHTYSFTPSGGLLAGGKISTFMIYNSNWTMPETIEGDLKMPAGCFDAPPKN